MPVENYNAEEHPDTRPEEGCFCFENLKVELDKKTEGIIDKKFLEEELAQITAEIDKTLGQGRSDAKIEIHSFSDRTAYEIFLEDRFPDDCERYKKDNAIFHQDLDKEERVVANHTPFNIHFSQGELEEIRERGMTPEEAEKAIKRIARANIFASMTHELVHLHPYFGGVGNDAAENRWEQEQVCVLLGERIRTRLGNTGLRKQRFEQAQEELRHEEKIDLQASGYDWDSSKEYETFFYPYLEKKYGIERLQQLWGLLSKKPKHPLSEAVRMAYGRELEDVEGEFKKAILEAREYSDIENN